MKSGIKLAEYPFIPRFMDSNGHRLAYLDEGKGPVVVMLHGNPSWSYLYRKVVRQLQGRYRCIVPDHLGCGFSDKPQEASYSLDMHIHNLEALLQGLGIDRCALILHDWGGAIGMGWAVRHPAQVAAIVACNTAAFASTRMPWRIAMCRWPIFGPLALRGLNAFARAAIFMAVSKKMRSEVAQGFLAPYDSWENRIALLRFVQDIPMNKEHPSWLTLAAIEAGLPLFAATPMLLCWGGADFCFDRHFYDEWRCRFPQAEAHYFTDAGHYLFEDALEDIAPLISRFLEHNLQVTP
mgnify:FL=1